MKKKHKRWRLLADLRIQGEICIKIAFYWVVCQLSLVGTMVAYNSIIGEANGSAMRFVWPAVAVSLLLLPIALFDAIKLSNRFVGPMVNLRGRLKEYKETGTMPFVFIRKGDFYGDVIAGFNDFSGAAGSSPKESATEIDTEDSNDPENHVKNNLESISDTESNSDSENRESSLPLVDMPSSGLTSGPSASRRGVATVEMALVAPFIFLLIFGAVEFSRMMMIKQALTNSAREGCRTACLATTQDNDRAEYVMRRSLVNVVAGARDSDNIRTSVQPTVTPIIFKGTTITTTVEVDCADVSWLPPFFTAGATIRGTSTMVRE